MDVTGLKPDELWLAEAAAQGSILQEILATLHRMDPEGIENRTRQARISVQNMDAGRTPATPVQAYVRRRVLETFETALAASRDADRQSDP